MGTLGDLVERVAATLRRHEMICRGQTIGVAVSGGADSVCLLHVLSRLAAEWSLRLHVLHLNHNLRGEESRADAEFVRRLAEEFGLPATIAETHLADSPGNLEQAAREARLAFFRQAALDRVAVGHTRTDQAETVLFRFLRGSGTAGLSGIRPVTTEGLIRPLIEVEREEVRTWLAAQGIAWREDTSNASSRFARNRIRRELMPVLVREWNPGIVDTLAQTAEWARDEEAYWEQELDRLAAGLLDIRHGAVLMNVEEIRALPTAAARRVIRRALERAKGNLRGVDFSHVEEVLSLCRRAQGQGHAAVPELEVVRSFRWLRVAPRRVQDSAARYSIPAAIPGTVVLPGGGSVSLELIEKSRTSSNKDYVYNKEQGCVDWSSVSGPLEFRGWMPGDRYQPAGSAGTEKIKTLFQRARIPLWERRGWPVLWDARSIVWVKQFGPSVQTVAHSSSSLILRIRESAAG